MEGSKRGKGSREKGLSILDPHVDGGNGRKKSYYIIRRKRKRKGEKKIKTEKREEFSTFIHSTRACPMILSVYVRV